MKIQHYLSTAVLLAASAVWAQTTMPAPPPGGPGEPQKDVFFMRHEGRGMHGLGSFWKDSDTAAKLGLSEGQKQQLEDAFFKHRLKMADIKAEMEKQDLKLEQLLNGETVDDAAVAAQAAAQGGFAGP